MKCPKRIIFVPLHRESKTKQNNEKDDYLIAGHIRYDGQRTDRKRDRKDG